MFSAVMVVVGLWVRLSLVESAAFERIVRTGQVHKIPLAAAIRTYWRELKRDGSLDGKSAAIIRKSPLAMTKLDSSVIAWRRRAVRDTALSDVSIPAGVNLVLLLGAGNRDPVTLGRVFRSYQCSTAPLAA
jgi:hypothetical protein